MLAYLGQVQVPFGATFADTVIGSLSAISYDPGRQLYYVISDDRSERNPARFYTVQLSLSDKGIDGVTFTGTHPLLEQSGQPFRRWRSAPRRRSLLPTRRASPSTAAGNGCIGVRKVSG